jgi:hypothetical protein
MGILAALIIGAIAGWLAGKIVHGAGFGLIGRHHRRGDCARHPFADKTGLKA